MFCCSVKWDNNTHTHSHVIRIYRSFRSFTDTRKKTYKNYNNNQQKYIVAQSHTRTRVLSLPGLLSGAQLVLALLLHIAMSGPWMQHVLDVFVSYFLCFYYHFRGIAISKCVRASGVHILHIDIFMALIGIIKFNGFSYVLYFFFCSLLLFCRVLVLPSNIRTYMLVYVRSLCLYVFFLHSFYSSFILHRALRLSHFSDSHSLVRVSSKDGRCTNLSVRSEVNGRRKKKAQSIF